MKNFNVFFWFTKASIGNQFLQLGLCEILTNFQLLPEAVTKWINHPPRTWPLKVIGMRVRDKYDFLCITGYDTDNIFERQGGAAWMIMDDGAVSESKQILAIEWLLYYCRPQSEKFVFRI